MYWPITPLHIIMCIYIPSPHKKKRKKTPIHRIQLSIFMILFKI